MSRFTGEREWEGPNGELHGFVDRDELVIVAEQCALIALSPWNPSDDLEVKIDHVCRCRRCDPIRASG